MKYREFYDGLIQTHDLLLDLQKLLKQWSLSKSVANDVSSKLYRIKFKKKKKVANSIDPDEAAHDELPHPDLRCLQILVIFMLWHYLKLVLVWAFRSIPDIKEVKFIPIETCQLICDHYKSCTHTYSLQFTSKYRENVA